MATDELSSQAAAGADEKAAAESPVETTVGSEDELPSTAEDGMDVPPQWWHSFAAVLFMTWCWLGAPIMVLVASVTMAVSLGPLYGSLELLLLAGLVVAKTGVQRAVVCGVMALIASSSLLALCATMVVTALTALLAVKVEPWPECLDTFTRRWAMSSYFKQCEIRGHLDSIREDKTVLAFHPHGILCCGFTMNGPWCPTFLEVCGKVTFLIDGNLRYRNPFFKILLDWYHHPLRDIQDASRATITKLMEAGSNIAIVAGGFMEATLFKFGCDRIAVKNRKNLVKLCLQHGYWLHPVYTFGESDTFYAWQGLLPLRLKLAKRNIPTVIFRGWSWCPILPFPSAELITYVGEPVQFPHIPTPEDADVDKWHAEYLRALERLFEENKASAGRPHAQFELY